MGLVTDHAEAVQEFSHAGLDPRIRCFRAGEEVDTFVVFTDRMVVYVDTVSTPSLMRQVIQNTRVDLNGRPVVALNTHADWDHVYGNQEFGAGGALPGLLVASQATDSRLRRGQAQERLAAQQAQEGRFREVVLTQPHLTFPNTLTLHGGDLTLELLSTPGHKPDHFSIWIPELRTLLAGDAAEFPLPCLTVDSDLTAMRASLTLMASLAPEIVLPCHGGTCTPELMNTNLAYLDRLAEELEHSGGQPDTPGLAYPEILAWLGTSPQDVPDFYRQFHDDAVEATRIWLDRSKG
jgi:glyoxylase-like metal-dependent hydrolase (beta-lactamase superfamily II)